MENLTLQEQEQTPDQFLTMFSNEKPPVSEALAKERAAKAHFALGEDSPGLDALYNNISVGNEESIRSSVALNEDTKYNQTKEVLINSLATQPSISPEDYDMVAGLAIPKVSDPSTVFERAFANKFINDVALNNYADGSPFKEGLDQDRQATLDKMDITYDIVARRQVLDTIIRDAEERDKDQAWVFAGSGEKSVVGDWLVGALPLYDQAMFARTVNPNTTLSAPSEMIQERIEQYYRMSPEQFKTEVSRDYETLHELNPRLAREYLGRVKEFTSTDAFIDNAFLALDLVGIGAGARAIVSGVKVSVNKALKDAVKASELPLAKPEDILSAVGDVPKASVVGATTKLAEKPVDKVTDFGALLKQTEERMLSTFQGPKRAFRNQMTEHKGKYSDVTNTFGDSKGNVFKTTQGAMKTAREKYNLTDDTFRIVPEDNGFVIQQFSRVRQNATDLDEVARELPSFVRPSDFLKPSDISREATQRLFTKLSAMEASVEGIVDSTLRVSRMSQEALAKAVSEAQDELVRDFVDVSDSIVHLATNNIDTNLANVQTVTMRLGKNDATLFKSADEAKIYANKIYNIGENDYSIVQHGTGFAIDITRPIRETSDGVREIVELEALSDKSNRRLPFREFVTGADEVFDPLQNANRKVAQQAHIVTIEKMGEIAKTFKTLPKDEREALDKIMRYNRDYMAPDGKRGMYFDNLPDLEQAYMTRIGRLPTEREVEAYYSYIKLNDLDWSLRNMALYRDRSRLGLKEYSFNVWEDGMSVKTGSITGLELDDLPWNNNKNSLVMVIPEDKTGPITFGKNELSLAERQAYQEKIKNGEYKVIQLNNPELRALKDFHQDRQPVQYVLTKNYQKQSLNPVQLDYNPGGHVDYVNGWFVKQPKIYQGRGGQWNYEGDTSIFNFSTQAQAREFSKAMEKGRQLLKANDPSLASHLKNTLPYSVDDFTKLFATDGYLDINTPITAVRKGRKIAHDQDFTKRYGNYLDHTSKENTIDAELNAQYVGARSGPLMTVARSGTEARPIFDLKPAEVLDPMSALGRALTQASSNRHYTDYKIGAAEDWIARYANVLKNDQDEIRFNPMATLSNPKWDLSHPDKSLLAEAKAAQTAILNFTGQQTLVGQAVDSLQQRLFDQIFNITGKPVSPKVADFLNTKDPATFMRSTAFHLKLGLFNPIQLFMQAQGIVNVLAISPRNGLVGSGSYPITRMILNSPSKANIDHAASLASKLGWNQDEYKEMFDALLKSGYSRVGQEHIFRDVMAPPVQFTNSAGRKFLDKGTMFFNTGEQFVRISAFQTSYLDWRKANPLKSLTQRDMGQILNRADMMAVNMTRASQAVWQRGFLNVPTQFFGYQARLMDLVLGKRLTDAEKVRVLGANMAAYGIPTGVSAAAGISFYEDIRKSLLDNGVNVDDTVLRSLVEGLPATALNLLTGRDYSVAQRYGPGGFDVIRKIMDGDMQFAEMVFGASGGIMADMYKNAGPLAQSIFSVLAKDGSYEPVLTDSLDMLKSITTVNQATKLILALNTQRYYSRKGQHIYGSPDAPFESFDAWVNAITGLEPTKITDMWLKMKLDKSHEENVVKYAQDQVSKYMDRALTEFDQGNQEAGDAYMKRVQAILIQADLNPRQQSQIMGRALQGKQSMYDRIQSRYWQNAPQSKAEPRLNSIINEGK